MRFLVGSIVAVTLLLSAWSWWEFDLEVVLSIGVVVVATLAFFGLYAATVWLIGHSIRGIWRGARRLVRSGRFRRRSSGPVR